MNRAFHALSWTLSCLLRGHGDVFIVVWDHGSGTPLLRTIEHPSRFPVMGREAMRHPNETTGQISANTFPWRHISVVPARPCRKFRGGPARSPVTHHCACLAALAERPMLSVSISIRALT